MAPLGTVDCGICGARSGVYEYWPECKECSDIVCPRCVGTPAYIDEGYLYTEACARCLAQAAEDGDVQEEGDR